MKEKYRKINKTDKFPSLPPSMKPVFYGTDEYIKEYGRIVFWAEDKEKRYTLIWDGIAPVPLEIYTNYK